MTSKEKMKLLLALIMTIALLFAAVAANAFEIRIHNDTDQKMLYNLIWVDCPLYGRIGPHSMAGGEILPHVVNDLEVKYDPGQYCVVWTEYEKGRPRKEISRYMLKVFNSLGLLISKPESLVFYNSL